MRMKRRQFLFTLPAPFLLRSKDVAIPADLETPYKVGNLVLRASGEKGSFDEISIDVPFVFWEGDRFYMTYVGFDGQGYQTGLASSANLIDWKPEGVILRRDPSSALTRHNIALTWILRENDLFSRGHLKKVGGRYLGTYHAYPGSGYETGPGVIGLCWSEDLRNWEVDPPCLIPGEGAEWERAGLYKSCLVQHQDTYYLFYNAKNRPSNWNEQIGFAVSTDLKNWKRHGGNPVIGNGGADSPDERFCADPCVLRYGEGWAVFYYGLDGKHVARDLLALSPDLRQFDKCSGVLIDVGPKGSVDSQYAHKPSVIHHEGILYHFYCAVSKEHGRGIGLATSRPVVPSGKP